MQRDKLIASVRRNSRLAYLRMQDQIASASASAQAAYQTISDTALDTWSESQLKEFCDKNSIKGECSTLVVVGLATTLRRAASPLTFPRSATR